MIKSNCNNSAAPTTELVAADGSLTVRVCLRRVFGSARARCAVRADRSLSVRWLVARLAALFPAVGASPRDMVLVSAGCVLPLDEPVAVLTPGDLVEVIPLCRAYGDEDERKFYAKLTSNFTSETIKLDAERPKDQIQEHSIVDRDSHSDQETTQDGHDSSDLYQMKRQALLLLDGYGGGALPRPAEEGIKHRRRRVRRRRPLAPAELPVQQNVGAVRRAPRSVRARSPPPPPPAHTSPSATTCRPSVACDLEREGTLLR